MQNVTFPAASQARWTVYTSDHFDVFHNSLPLERVSEAVRDAEAAYVGKGQPSITRYRGA